MYIYIYIFLCFLLEFMQEFYPEKKKRMLKCFAKFIDCQSFFWKGFYRGGKLQLFFKCCSNFTRIVVKVGLIYILSMRFILVKQRCRILEVL